MNARPWPGLASFTEAQQAQFHGRAAELAELLRRVSAKRLTLLFGQSGLGKTSLLQAGLLPRLREAGYAPQLLRIDYRRVAGTPEQQIQAALAWPRDQSLWEQLHNRQRSGPPPVLLFDQFEELFTLGAASEVAGAFVELLADLVENRPPAGLESRLEVDESLLDGLALERSDYRLLIALREDYLAPLEALRKQIPSLMQNRMRLAPMRGEQALQAACGPGGDLLSLDCATAIVRFVAGGAELEHAEIEPALLSLVLHELNEQRIAAGAARISADQLAGSHAAILADFYERSLADLPPGVRGLIEDQLLTESGFRDSLSEERLQRLLAGAGAPPDALATLVARRLLRVEERLGQRRVELTHDVLCTVVQGSRAGRREREAQAAAEAQSRQDQLQFAQARRQTLRARWWTAGAALLGLAAIVGTGMASLAAQRAQRAELLAAQAHGEMQQVIAFLLEDFRDELRAVRRVDVLGRLSQRTLDYYRTLPPKLQGGDTARFRAQALLLRASVMLDQFRFDEARPLVDEALGLLQGREAGLPSEAHALVTAGALLAKLDLQLSGAGDDDGALATAEQAEALLRPWGRKSARAGRAWCEALAALGSVQQRADAHEQANTSVQTALERLPTLAAGPETSRWAASLEVALRTIQIRAMQGLGRWTEARRIGEQAEFRAGEQLRKDPGQIALRLQLAALRAFHMTSLRAVGELERALQFAIVAKQDARQLQERDPQAAEIWENLGFAGMEAARVLREAGRTAEALREAEQAIDWYMRPAPGFFTLADARNTSLLRLRLLLERREYQPALAELARLRRLTTQNQAQFPALAAHRATRLNQALIELQAHGLAMEDKPPRMLDCRRLVPQPQWAQNDCLQRLGDAELHAALIRQDARAIAAAAAQLEPVIRSFSSYWLHLLDNHTRERHLAWVLRQRAWAVLSMGQQTEARRAADEAHALLERDAARGRPTPRFQLEQAESLLLQALLYPDRRGDLTKRGLRLIAGLPAELRELNDTRRLRDRLLVATQGHGP